VTDFDTVSPTFPVPPCVRVGTLQGLAGNSHTMKLGSEFRGFGRFMALGIQMIVTTSVIAGIGWWLDRRTDSEPLFLIVFFLLGALAGIAVVWRAVYQDDGKDGK
jgi:F0F1-type ATP synthase assembly protein I